EILERLGIVELATRRPRELSGGQQQRVALGRALAPDPEVLLLDEPLSALDVPIRLQLRSALQGVVQQWRGSGRSVVLVTHDLTEAYQLGERIAVYEAGRVVQVAPKGALLARPASESVAKLVGMRNIVRGTVVKATPDRIEFAWRGQT